MISVIVAVTSLLLCAAFLLVKVSGRIKITRPVLALHYGLSVLAIITFIVMAAKLFRPGWQVAVGVMFIIFGLLVVSAGFHAIKMQAFVPKKKLVVQGIYKRIRNPLYAGLLLACYGTVLLAPSWQILAYAIMLTIVFSAIAKTEEIELRKRFGKQYGEYRKRVGFFLP